jgi:hypothetical protein
MCCGDGRRRESMGIGHLKKKTPSPQRPPPPPPSPLPSLAFPRQCCASVSGCCGSKAAGCKCGPGCNCGAGAACACDSKVRSTLGCFVFAAQPQVWGLTHLTTTTKAPPNHQIPPRCTPVDVCAPPPPSSPFRRHLHAPAVLLARVAHPVPR